MSVGVDGLSSGDYHSAEDVPLDDRNYSNEYTSVESSQKSVSIGFYQILIRMKEKLTIKDS